MDGWVAVTVKNQKLIDTNEVSRDSTIRSKNSFDPLDSHSTPIGPNPPLLPHATTLPLPTTTTPDDVASTTTQPCSSRQQLRKRHARHILHLLAQQEDAFLNRAIATAEHERTRLAKEDLSNPRRQAIDAPQRCTFPHTPRYQPWPNPRLQRQKSCPEAHLHQACSLCPHAHGPPLSPRPRAHCPCHL